MDTRKLKLIRSLHLLGAIPDDQLILLGERLKAVPVSDGAVLFEEGSQGAGMYFVSEGRIRISKRVSGQAFKDLAILGPGEYFGEMELVGGAKRSARASAIGDAVVFELGRDDMNDWLKSHPDRALGFFAELARTQSKRLNRTSSELALLYDLSNLILEPHADGKDLLTKVLNHIIPHLEGSWQAAAYLYNIYNQEMDRVASHGQIEDAPFRGKLPPPSENRDAWIDDRSYYASLPGLDRPHGYLFFQSIDPLTDADRTNTGRTLTTVTRLLAAAVENIKLQNEASLRDRLKAQSYGTRI